MKALKSRRLAHHCYERHPLLDPCLRHHRYPDRHGQLLEADELAKVTGQS